MERFVDDIKRSREGDASSAAEERLTLLEKKLRECEDREEKQALAVKLQEAMKETLSFLQRAQMAVLYLNLYAYHDVNLIALLRMLVIMEYVNINHAPSISAGKGDKERRRARSFPCFIITIALIEICPSFLTRLPYLRKNET